ncbi:MAG: molybdenum cofactor guanylyltransferase MobA [Plesiomonas sp.]|uniref:molybdenum cofactor guanylyltransferase MobA n=1 Tax=Plesiomonas sp. TaxID=2486279 RepID=UPI003F3FF8B2
MKEPITGVILAGGKARRMGGIDKGLIVVADKMLYQHVAQRLAPQVSQLLINANRHITEYRRSGYPVYADSLAGYPGPLAGMLTALQHAHTDWILCVPCDSPLLPPDLAARLLHAVGTADCAIVTDGEQVHPVFALLHRRLIPALQHFLQRDERKLMLFFALQHCVTVDFSDQAMAFCNVNTPDNCMMIEPLLRSDT